MAAVAQNTFTISGSSEFTEQGFSRIPKGMHHHQLSLDLATPSIDLGIHREYTLIGTIDLSHIGPQVIEKFKVRWDGSFLRDLQRVVPPDDDLGEQINMQHQIMFTTSLPTELSALDKSVTPSAFEYTSAQYRLEKFNSGQFVHMGAQIIESGGSRVGGLGHNFGTLNIDQIPWMNRWVELETKPLVVSTTLAVFFSSSVTINGLNFLQFNTNQEDIQNIDIDVLTRNHPMSNEDLWFARKLFNQGPENRLIYYRFANNPS